MEYVQYVCMCVCMHACNDVEAIMTDIGTVLSRGIGVVCMCVRLYACNFVEVLFTNVDIFFM